MLAVDTNLIIRYLVLDHPEQSKKAMRAIDRNEVFVPVTVLLEAEWVLRSLYGLDRQESLARLRAFAGLPRVNVEAPSATARAFEWAEAGLDFGGALHIAASGHCEAFLSFDRDLLRRSQRLTGLTTRAP